MALDLNTIARVVGGECVAHGVAARTPIDGLTRIGEYVVVGNPAFATLVTGTVAELRARLASVAEGAAEGTAAVGAVVDTADVTAISSDSAEDTVATMSRAVFVTTADDQQLRQLLERHSMTAVIGARGTEEALHPRLSALIAEDQAAADRLVTAGTKVLTQVARRGGVTAVIAELAHHIDGWAVLIDANGHLIASAGAGRLHIDDAVAVALGRQVRVRHRGLQTHQVGSDRDLAGYLVIASRSDVSSRNRDLASQAAALFDLVLRTRDPSITEHLGREALLNILFAGGSEAADLLQRWGVRETSLTAFELGTKSRTVDLERLVERWFDELGAEHIFMSEAGRARGFLPDDLVDDLCEKAAAFNPLGSGSVHLGLGLPAPVEALGNSAVQARQALASALEYGRVVLRFTELSTIEYVLDSVDEGASLKLADVLDQLRDASGAHGELTETLRVFLVKHGAHRASAAELGIHRQTLLARVHRIEQLTGLSMDRADDRAVAWLALRALGM